MALFKNLRELLGAKPKEMCLCMVVSEQEGAEIWVNDQRTNYVTPKLVAIPKDESVKVEVRLVGHENHSAMVRSSHNLTYYYCNLKRIPLKLISGGLSSHEINSNSAAYL